MTGAYQFQNELCETIINADSYCQELNEKIKDIGISLLKTLNPDQVKSFLQYEKECVNLESASIKALSDHINI
jgi:hypothetical protein